MTTAYKTFKAKAFKNPATKREYEALLPEYTVITSLIERRLKHGWSQTELAKKAGTKQPVISRLESGEGNPTLLLLQRIATALDATLRVSID